MFKLMYGASRFCFAPEGGEGGSGGGGGEGQGQQQGGDQGQQQQQSSGGEGQQQQQSSSSDFSIPDAYKEQGWAKNIKSNEDVWKMLDSSQKLVGQKTIQPIDYSKATPEEIKAHHEKLAPQDIKAYNFAQPDDPTSQAVGNAFREAGINEHQGQAVIKALAPFFDKMENDIKSQSTSEEGYMKLSQEAFGDKFKETIGKVENVLKTHAPDDATKKALDDMPNDQRIAVDKTVNKIVESYEAKIADIYKKHGIHETGAQGEGGQGKVGGNIEETRKQLRADIRALDARPHTADEKKALTDRLAATYNAKQ